MSEHYWWVPGVIFYGGFLCVSLILLVRKKFKQGILLGAGTLLLLFIAIPGMKPARPIAQRNACHANLKQVNSAVEKWSKQNNMAAGDKIDVASVVSDLKGGKLPTCPAGGFYKLSTVGTPVSCSLPEHEKTENGHTQ
jgi:hypothetical protein